MAEQAIRDVLLRYFYGLDRREPDVFDSVFLADATMSVLDGQHSFAGRAEIVTSLLRVAAYPHSSHHPTSQRIDVSGDEATVDTFAVAYLVTCSGKVIVRGLQYLDRLRETPDGWRIEERKHIPLWQFEADAVPTSLPAET